MEWYEVKRASYKANPFLFSICFTSGLKINSEPNQNKKGSNYRGEPSCIQNPRVKILNRNEFRELGA